MKLGQTYFSGSITFDEGNNFIGPDTSILTGSFTGSVVGTFEGDFTGASSTAISGAFTSVSESIATNISTNSSSIASLEAASGSYLLNTTDTLTGDLTVTGEVIAQTLHVQEVTSSIVYSSGSNVFGETVADTQKFTGSLQVSGSSHYLLGNVGIGTDNPGQKLNIQGTDTNVTLLRLDNFNTSDSGTETNEILFTHYRSYVPGLNDAARIVVGKELAWDASGDRKSYMSFNTRNAEAGVEERMRIDSSGRLLVGKQSTSYSTEGIEIRSNEILATNDGGTVLSLNRLSSDGVILSIAQDTSTVANIATNGADLYFDMNEGGNIGIGQSSPDEKLDVNGNIVARNSSFPTFKVQGSDVNYQGRMRWDTNNNVLEFLTRHAGTYYSDTLVLKEGKVGIGTNSPSKTLDVNGVVRSRNSFNLSDGTTQIGGLFPYKVITGTGTDNSTALFTETGLDLHFMTSGSVSSKMIIKANGNVGINTTDPQDKLEIKSGYLRMYDPSSNINAGYPIRWTSDNGGTNVDYADIYGITTSAGNRIGHLVFRTSNSGAPSEKMRITSGGYLKASNYATYFNVSDSYHEFVSNDNNWTTLVGNTNSTPYGILVEYSNNPNNSSSFPFYFNVQGVGKKIAFRSDGGLENIQSNDVNLSDIRVKKDIVALGSYWDKFKALEVVTFKYIDQSHDNDNIGFIAQQVETVAPEFISDEGWQQDAFDNEEEPLKAIYTADIYNAAIKVLQEAMAKIEVLEAKIAALEGK